MKRLPPNSLLARSRQFVRFHGWKIVIAIFWMWIIWSSLKTQAETRLPELNWCVINSDVPAGQLLKPNQVSSQKVQALTMPENVVSDCQNQALFENPLAIDVQTGDILQLSTFNAADVSNKILQQNLQNQKIIFYLQASDFHALPQNLPVGSHLTIYGKLKNEGLAELIGQKVEIVTIYQPESSSNSTSTPTLIGLAVTPDLALSLTKVLTDEWSLYGVIEQ